MSIGQDRTRLDFIITKNEKALLEHYCSLTGRSKTDVLRELIRGLQGRVEWLETETDKYVDQMSLEQ